VARLAPSAHELTCRGRASPPAPARTVTRVTVDAHWRALEILTDRLAASEVTWALSGTAAMAAHGIDVTCRDLDAQWTAVVDVTPEFVVVDAISRTVPVLPLESGHAALTVVRAEVQRAVPERAEGA
jgi:hypothetical protein